MLNKKVKITVMVIVLVGILLIPLQSVVKNKLLDRKNALEKGIISKYFTNSDIQIKLNTSKIIVNQGINKQILANNFIYLQLRNGKLVNSESNNSNFTNDYMLIKCESILDNYAQDSFYFLKLTFKSNERDLLNMNGQKTGTGYSVFVVYVPTNISISKVGPSDNFLQNVYKLWHPTNVNYDLNLTSINGIQKYYSYTTDSNNAQEGQQTFYYFDMLITPSNSAINEVSTAPIKADNYEQIVAEEQKEYNQSHIVVDTQSVSN